MAKEYENFKKEFADIQKLVAEALQEIDKDQRAIGQTTGVVKEGVKELGLRVQELKSTGMKGSGVDDFRADKDVQQIMASINSYMTQISKELERINGLNNGSFKTTKTRFFKLKDELTKEIAARKKQLSTKTGTGNKSLPDMEKLLAEIKKYEDGSFSRLSFFTPEQFADHTRDLDNDIKQELAKTKEAALSELQKMMDEQALNTRVLVHNEGRVVIFHKQVLDLAAAVENARKANNPGDMKKAQQGMIKFFNDLNEIVARYERGMQDQWVLSKLKTSKDKGKIEGAVAHMKTLKEDARKRYTATAQLKPAVPPKPGV